MALAFERFTGDLGAFVRNAAAEEVEWLNTAPAHVRACVTVSFGAAGERLETYSEAGLRLLQDDIRHLPQYAAVEALTNTHERRRGLPQFTVGVTRQDDDHGRWFQLTSSVAASLTSEQDGDIAILTVLREVAEHSNPSSASIYWFNGGGPPLEKALKLFRSDTVPRSRMVLRDYGWLTVLAQELGDRLGGTAALQDSGAFHEVAQLEAGGYWLLATPRWAEYGLEQAQRLFEVFAPVLPPGRPDALRAAPNVIVDRDPSEAAR